MSYKNLKLTLEAFKSNLDTVAEGMSGKVTSESKKDGHTRFSIEIPGQGTALIDIYDTDKGLTIHHKIGKLQEVSEAIAKAIAESCDTVTTNTHTFKGITEELYSDFIDSFESDYTITTQKDDEKQQTVKIATTKPDVTVTWYKTTHTLMIQGLTTSVWDEVALWFAGKIQEDPDEIITLIFDSKIKFEGVKISYDESYIEKLLRDKIGDAYDNTKILRGFEVKWLKMSQFFLNLDIDLPDYYPTISTAMKIIEGILKRICTLKFGLASFNGGRSFIQFEETAGQIKLKDIFKPTITNPDALARAENLYIFLRTKRHPLSHNDGLSGNPAVITDKAEAVSLFDEIISLINETNRFKRDLF